MIMSLMNKSLSPNYWEPKNRMIKFFSKSYLINHQINKLIRKNFTKLLRRKIKGIKIILMKLMIMGP